jgi:nucleoside-diphosphate-sugar epimerase
VALQAVGWGTFALSMLCGLLALFFQAQALRGARSNQPALLALTGLLGAAAEAAIVASLFVYEDREPLVGGGSSSAQRAWEASDESPQAQLLQAVVDFNFGLINKAFGPADPERETRSPVEPGDAYLACPGKWARVTKHCVRTGDRYLVIGCGFVGKRLVNRLLERGETDVRVFDIAPCDFWPGDKRVQFIRGDVTKLDQISKACEGVNTIYATFAIIRFMERLAHQAWLSYHINVTGTETLLEACKINNVKRLIVTSSSHATTDEHSMPRFNRDETAKLLTRKEAHNHYGWTKAIADELAIKADGMKLNNGQELEVTVVRPCSGVFGADDKLSFEKVMTMGVAPGVGASMVMDWVYVENVVLGHILAEAALQQGRGGVRGEAFCISNDDPVNMQDFFMLTKKIIRNLPDKKMRKALPLTFLWIPMAPLWAIAYISELNQWLFKGKVSLGRDVDMLTPPMLATATMEYTYTSAKARKVLGYEPVFLLEEAIQTSLHELYETRSRAKK